MGHKHHHCYECSCKCHGNDCCNSCSNSCNSLCNLFGNNCCDCGCGCGNSGCGSGLTWLLLLAFLCR